MDKLTDKYLTGLKDEEWVGWGTLGLTIKEQYGGLLW